jgi:hypothetical protein
MNRVDISRVMATLRVRTDLIMSSKAQVDATALSELIFDHQVVLSNIRLGYAFEATRADVDAIKVDLAVLSTHLGDTMAAEFQRRLNPPSSP